MNTFLQTISETNDYMKTNQKKEYLKLYGEAAAVFEDALLPFISKVLSFILKKLKDPDQTLHTVAADSIGLLVHHSLKNLENGDEKSNTVLEIFKIMFGQLNAADKKIQAGAGSCLTRVI